MKFNIHAGHNKDGYIACGAVGLIKESTQARSVKKRVIKKLRKQKHTVYDCTVDKAPSVGQNLAQIVHKCNAHKVDLDVSIHFNSGAFDQTGNEKTTGVEVLVYGNNSKAIPQAQAVCEEIAKLGFKNRGVKYRPGLYVLRHTDSPAMLIECCFVDDRDDVKLYNAEKMANAIVKGLTKK